MHRSLVLAGVVALLLSTSSCLAGVSVVNGLVVEGDRGLLCPLSVLTSTVTGNGTGDHTLNAHTLYGDVEVSMHSALNYAEVVAKQFGFSTSFSKMNIRLEFTGKYASYEGKSAGVTFATGIIAALSNRPVRRDVAMTGDISQLGTVNAVRGIPQKLTGAMTSGMRTIIIPALNVQEVPPLDEDVLRQHQIICAAHMAQVLFHALGPSYPGRAYEPYFEQRCAALKAYDESNWKNFITLTEAFLQRFPEIDLSMIRLLKIAKEREEEHQKANQLLDDARAAQKKEDWPAALAHYREALVALTAAQLPTEDLLKQTQTCLAKAKLAGDQALEKGLAEKALGVYSDILACAPDYPDVAPAREKAKSLYITQTEAQGRQLINQEQFDDALKLLGAAQSRCPDDPALLALGKNIRRGKATARYDKALELLKLGQREAAIGELNAARGIDPTLETASAKLAELNNAEASGLAATADKLFSEGKYEEARAVYQTSLAKGSPSARVSRLITWCSLAPEIAPKLKETLTSGDFSSFVKLCRDRQASDLGLELMKGRQLSLRGLLAVAALTFDTDPTAETAICRQLVTAPNRQPLPTSLAEEGAQALKLLKAGDRAGALATVRQSPQISPIEALLESTEALYSLTPGQSSPAAYVPAYRWALLAAHLGGDRPELQAWAATLGTCAGYGSLANAHLAACAQQTPRDYLVTIADGIICLLNDDAAKATGASADLAACATPADDRPYAHYLRACLLGAAAPTAPEAERAKMFMQIQDDMRKASQGGSLVRYCQDSPALKPALVTLLREYALHMLLSRGSAIVAAPCAVTAAAEADSAQLFSIAFGPGQKR